MRNNPVGSIFFFGEYLGVFTKISGVHAHTSFIKNVCVTMNSWREIPAHVNCRAVSAENRQNRLVRSTFKTLEIYFENKLST